MPFFDFLPSIDRAKYNPSAVNRMNFRHDFIIDRFRQLIEGARVVDLASHDGRWCYAFAGAGAEEVIGIEGRPELVEKFGSFPDTPYKARVHLITGDIFDVLREFVSRHERADVIGILGVYYHIMDHFGLLKLACQLKPKLIIIDSAFMTEMKSFIAIGLEDTSNHLASIPQVRNQRTAVVGTVSQLALENMATALGFRVQWLDWNIIPAHQRAGLADYFRAGNKRRFTCALWPMENPTDGG